MKLLNIWVHPTEPESWFHYFKVNNQVIRFIPSPKHRISICPLRRIPNHFVKLDKQLTVLRTV